MRWYWIDRYLEFEPDSQAIPGAPVMPNSLILEGMAQTAGLLVAVHYNFDRDVVLAKVARAAFHLPALPGETLVYRAKLEDLKEDGAFARITSHVGAKLQGEAEVFFAYLPKTVGGRKLYEFTAMLNWLRTLRVFEVGRYGDGSPLTEASLTTAVEGRPPLAKEVR